MKQGSIARVVLLILFLLFVGLYLVGNSNYYDYDTVQKTRLTEEQIEIFEEDVKNGKAVDVEDYLKINEKNYDNAISRATLTISNTISKSFDKALTYLFGKLNDVMNEK